jgi:hypothetical protein
MSALHAFYDNKELSDCSIKLRDGTLLFTHKIVLWQEDYFKSKYKFNSNPNDESQNNIDLSLFSQPVVINYIKCLYGVENLIYNLSHDNIVEQYTFLDFLCSKFLPFFLELIVYKCSFNFNDKEFINYWSIIKKHPNYKSYDKFISRCVTNEENIHFELEHIDLVYSLVEDIFASGSELATEVIKKILSHLKTLVDVNKSNVKEHKNSIKKCVELIIAIYECPTNEMCVNMIRILKVVL